MFSAMQNTNHARNVTLGRGYGLTMEMKHVLNEHNVTEIVVTFLSPPWCYIHKAIAMARLLLWLFNIVVHFKAKK